MCLYRAELPRNRADRLRSARSTIADAVPRHDVDDSEEPASEEVDATAETDGAGEGETGEDGTGEAKAGEDEDAVQADAVAPETEGADAAPAAASVKKTIRPIVENCTECKKELPGAFFTCRTCVGESCTSHVVFSLTKLSFKDAGDPILILCDECAFKPKLENVANEDHTFTAHFLVLVRNRNVSYIHGEPEPESEPEEEAADEPTVSALAEQVKGLQTQMSTMLELIQALHISLAARPAPE